MGFYQNCFAELGERTVVDSKGSWTISHVCRNRYIPECRHHYTVSIQFKPNLLRIPKASPWGVTGGIFMRGCEDIEMMKRRIKDYVGYTPSADVLDAFWTHFTVLRDAYEAEDAFYAAQDRENADRLLMELENLAVLRFEKGEEKQAPKHRFDRNRPPMDVYLTEGEYRLAVEAQKVLNGHAYVEPYSVFGRSGHLADFNERIQTRIDEIKRSREIEARQEKRKRLRGLLDTDPEFRRLVANAMAAAKESRAGKTEYELAFRYFGYVSSLEEYRKVYSQFSELMKQFGLETYETDLLVSLGREYLAEGEMLPVPVAPFERPEGIFYQDWICTENRFYQVDRVGRLYVYVAGDRFLKREVRPFVWMESPAVDSLESAIFDHLVWLHNTKFIPYAYELAPAEAVKKLFLIWRRLVVSAYQRRIQYERHPLKKKAAQLFADAIRCLQLLEQRDQLVKLLSVYPQSALAEIEQEIRELAERNQIARALVKDGMAAVMKKVPLIKLL